MTVTFTIPGKLPSLNEFIRADRSHWSKGAKMKQEAEETVMWCIRLGLKGQCTEKPVRMSYRWYEANDKRDLDNVSSFGRKVIQDSLVKMGTLKDDGWGYVAGFTDDFFIDPDNPRIVVDITEVEQEIQKEQ